LHPRRGRLQEAIPRAIVVVLALAEHLDHHVSLEPRLGGPIHVPKATLPEQFANNELAQRSPTEIGMCYWLLVA
jgi:hypothetical protein